MYYPRLLSTWWKNTQPWPPLALIIGGIAAYGVFVFNFYRFLAKDMFTLNLQ